LLTCAGILPAQEKHRFCSKKTVLFMLAVLVRAGAFFASLLSPLTNR
jgi:hypothetical protein